MAINFANVNISLQQFQAVASGKYNAGEVKLASESALEKTNNHVHMKWRNATAISHEEVLAVKNAFIRALNSAGIVGEELDNVRARLGLANNPGGEGDAKLGERSMKPLTRQQIREILDTYAGTINASLGAGTIRTSDELNARVSQRDREDRATRRDNVNASLDRSRTVASNRDAQIFARVVSGDLDGLMAADSSRMLQIVRSQLQDLRQTYGDNPPADDRPVLSFTLEGGQKIEFQAPGSTAEFAAHLEDAEFFLANRPPKRNDGTVPPIDHRDWNRAVRDALTDEYEQKPMPHEVRMLEKEILDEVRAKFGEDIVPQNARIGALITNESFSEVSRLVDEAGNARRISLDDVRTVLRAEMTRYCVDAAVTKRIVETAASLGIELRPNLYGDRLTKGRALVMRNPAVADAVRRATTQAEISAALDAFKPDIEKIAKIGAKLDSVQKTCKERIIKLVAEKTGLPACAIANRGFVDGYVESMMFFLDNLAQGKIKCDSAEEAEAAFNAKLESFANERADALAKIKQFGLAGKTVATLNKAVLSARSIKSKTFDMDAFRQIANTMKPEFETLKSALDAPGRTKADGIAALKAFAVELDSKLLARFGKLEPDEKFLAMHIIAEIALDGEKAVAEKALAFINELQPDDFADAELVGARALFSMVLPDKERVNGEIKSSLGRSYIMPHDADALIAAARKAGLTAPTEEEILALFNPGKPAGKAVADAIGSANEIVTPAMLEAFATEALAPYKDSILNGAAPEALNQPVPAPSLS